MRERMRMTGLFTTCLVAGFGFTGCQDQAAQERVEVQEIIRKENTAFQLARVGAPVPGTKEFDTKKQELDVLAGRLSSIRGGNAGQQGTKSVLLANTMTELASMDMAHAENYERINASISAQVIGIIQGGMNLNGMLESRQVIDLQTSRSQLNRDMETAEEKLGQLNEQLAELEGPIADREGQNTRDAEEVNALRKSSDKLFRNAREQGYASGFNSFEEAIQARRAADRIEYEIAQREIVLDLNLKAEQGYINLNTQQINKAIEAISDAQAAIDTHEQTGREDLRNTEQLIATLRGDLDALLQKLANTTNNELNPHYDSAQEYLEKSAREAQTAASKAGRNGDTNGPHLIGARAHASLGKLHWTKSRGISIRLKLYELIHQARDVFSEDSVLSKIEQLNQQHADAVEKAKAAYAQAIQLLSQVNNPKAQNEINAFKQSLDLALASLEGKDVSAMMQPAPAAKPETSSPDPDTSEARFPTPEALISHLQNLLASGDITSMADLTHAETPAGKRLLSLGRDAVFAMNRFIKAAEQKMGDEIGPMLESIKAFMQMGGSIPDLSSAKVTERSDDRVVYETSAFGQASQFGLVRVNGSWMIDGDIQLQRQLQNMGGEGPMLDAAEKMIKSAAEMYDELARKINSGEITTMEQMSAEMMKLGETMMGNN